MKTNLYFVLIAILASSCAKQAEFSGELKKKHNITLIFEEPESDEIAIPNPFADYH